MLNADDKQTITSLNRLRRIVGEKNKPLVIWLGAGVSSWAGLSSWKELARSLNRDFGKLSASYDKDAAKAALLEPDFPRVFQLCSDADSGLYRSLLTQKLRVASPTDLYSQFVEKLKKIRPACLLTTNADTALEQHFTSLDTVERTDLGRFQALCQQKADCLGKLHGSISSIESLVFTTNEYERLKSDSKYIETLQNIFASSSVVFLGYGLRDEYVLRLLKDQSGTYQLFGSGPHFIVTDRNEAPDCSIHPIRYSLKQHPDHRSAMTILDFIVQSYPPKILLPDSSTVTADVTESAFYITEFRTPGTHTTSQTGQIVGEDGDPKLITVGLGWVEGEQLSSASHALHDLLVGLICFDKTYIPLLSLDSAFNALGEEVFKELLSSGSLKLLFSEQEPGILLEHQNLVGTLTTITTVNGRVPNMLTLDQLIRRFVKPVPGREPGHEQFIDLLIKSTLVTRVRDESIVPNMTKSALLMPKVSAMLGFGEAILPSQTPSWLRFPVLRLAHLVQTSQICQDHGIIATRLPFGGAALVSAAFGVNPNDLFTDQYASYVVSGRHQVRLDQYLEQNPRILLNVLKFRDTQAGIDLRKNVVENLRTEDHTEFGPSVDAGLKKILPLGLLELARGEMQALMLADGTIARTPAVWANPHFDDSSARLWRDVARKNLLDILRQRGESTSSPCLCGSGDSVGQCCLQALRA